MRWDCQMSPLVILLMGPQMGLQLSSSDYELTEGHPPNGKIAGGHPPSLMMSSHTCVAGHVTGSNTSGASL